MSRNRTILAAVAVGAVIVAIGLTMFLVARSSDEATPPTTSAAEGTGPSTFESFDQPAGSLADTSTPEGYTWQVSDGDFRVGLGLVTPDDAPRSLATIDLGAVPLAVTMEMLEFREGAGLMFRYLDPSNYWSVTAAPAYGTWNINQVVDGKFKYRGNTGLGLSSNSTVEVRLDGPAIRVSVNAQRRASLVSGDLQQATGVGLVATDQGTGRAVWTSIGVLGR